MKKIVNILVLLIAVVIANAQVHIDKSINLTGGNGKSQIWNLGSPSDTSALADVNTIIKGYALTATVTGGDTILATLPYNLASYSPGLEIRFVAIANNTGRTFININNLGLKEILTNVTDTLNSKTIINGNVISIVYDGANFQLLSRTDNGCPSGYVSVNAEYCIEIDERNFVTYYVANRNCNNSGARLCSWEEWYYACINTGLGLNNMSGNWEWINDGTNHGDDAQRVNGTNNCTSNNSYSARGLNGYFRCCYSKK